MTTLTRYAPQICVAVLGLEKEPFDWITVTSDADELRETVQAFCTKYGGEEWEIVDYDEFHGYGSCNFDELCDFVRIVQDNDLDPALFAGLISYYGYSPNDCIEYHNENYLGCYESLEDYAIQVTEDCYEPIPKHVQFYINWEDMGRDMELNGEIFSIELGYQQIHIYRNA